MTASLMARRPVESVHTSVGDRRRTIVNVLRAARHRIDLSVFRCDDPEIFAELTRATARGVTVNALLTARAKGGRRDLETLRVALTNTGAALHVYADPTVKYHAKFIVVDEGPAVVASCNFTLKCFERTCDALVLTHDPDVVAGLRTLLAADRDGAPMPTSLPPRIIVGPELARRQLTTLIAGARSSIRVLDAKLSDPQIVRLLNARRAEGLTVEVFDQHRLGWLKSHGKILLIDDRLAVVGSLAFAPLSLDLRREIAIVVEERQAVAEVARLFRMVTPPRHQHRSVIDRMNHALSAPVPMASSLEEALC